MKIEKYEEISELIDSKNLICKKKFKQKKNRLVWIEWSRKNFDEEKSKREDEKEYEFKIPSFIEKYSCPCYDETIDKDCK